ncbi:Fic family protein [Lentisphaera profundi]|uniref:Fic family protein n=1 Tax=Lentisphaera profundi TaxID=1658616 RepID=A0ABY7VUX9_9BACT|nr:Fic family protein [Lentisphaera profundi]WDE97549.1 Fic family protein [Lentisphaera profundi]
MMKFPPKTRIQDPFNCISKNSPELLGQYLELFSPVDRKGRYLPFDEITYRIPKGLDEDLVWSVIKSSREKQLKKLIVIGEPVQACHYYSTPTIQKAISETDRNTTTASLEWMCNKIGEEKHLEYLLNDLIEDEAISSSQLEGAATTTKIAKDMLKRKRKPRTPDEKMILGNFKMMQLSWQNRHKDLSVDLILELHKVGVEDIDNDHYYPGVLRNTDNVEVVDADGNTVHTPPPAEGLEQRLINLAEWTNQDHGDIDSDKYLHPLLKAISLHFAIGYEHPFRDGNGRVARALFYWYMFKNDFSAFRYISISLLLKSAPVKYGKSYLYTETDDMDLTYFLDYQSHIILRAIGNFKNSYKKSLQEESEFNKWLWESGLYGKLNEKQKTVFQVAKSKRALSFTAMNVKDNLNCSYNTAATVLNGLVDLGLFEKKKLGREWVFSIRGHDKIIELWKN